MLRGIITFLAAAAESLRLWLGMKRDKLLREAGRNEQKVSDLENDRKQASKARARSEDVDRMDDATVTDGLRKYARGARKRPL